MHCFLHVWNLGAFHVMITTTAVYMSKIWWNAVVLGIANNKTLFPYLGNQFRDFKVEAKQGGGFSVRVGGRKANGVHVDELMPTIVYLMAFHLEESGVTEAFWNEMTDADKLFWQQESRLGRVPGYDSDDWEDFLQRPWADVGKLILTSILQRFRDAYMLTQSVQSSIDFEDKTVFTACGMFVDALHNCRPFAIVFKNKPKALAIMEIAMQRQMAGSALLFSQVTRETAHRSQRDAKNRSNFKNPEMWVIMMLHRRYSMRLMLEGGTLNVFNIPVDPESGRPDANRFRCFSSPLSLQALLNDVFSNSDSVSTNIAFKPPMCADTPDWVEKRVKPSLLWGMAGRVSGAVRRTFNQAFIPPGFDRILLLQTNPVPRDQRTLALAFRNTDGMRVVEFAKLKRKRNILDHEQLLCSGTVVRCVEHFYLFDALFACRMDDKRDLTFVVAACRSLARVAPFGRYRHIAEFFLVIQPGTVLVDAVAITEDEFVRFPACSDGCKQSADGKFFHHVCSKTKMAVGYKVR
jgi:hypothetical protein